MKTQTKTKMKIQGKTQVDRSIRTLHDKFMAGVLFIALCSSIVLLYANPPIVNAEPAYAKWGAIAVAQAQSKYGAVVKDYAHIGRTVLSDSVAEETFRLLMKKENEEFTVQVKVQFNMHTDEITNVDFVIMN